MEQFLTIGVHFDSSSAMAAAVLSGKDKPEPFPVIWPSTKSTVFPMTLKSRSTPRVWPLGDLPVSPYNKFEQLTFESLFRSTKTGLFDVSYPINFKRAPIVDTPDGAQEHLQASLKSMISELNQFLKRKIKGYSKIVKVVNVCLPLYLEICSKAERSCVEQVVEGAFRLHLISNEPIKVAYFAQIQAVLQAYNRYTSKPVPEDHRIILCSIEDELTNAVDYRFDGMEADGSARVVPDSESSTIRLMDCIPDLLRAHSNALREFGKAGTDFTWTINFDTTVPSVGQVNITHTNIVEGILDPLLSDIRSVLRFHTTSGGRLSAVKSTVFLNGAMAEWPYLHSYLRRDENILGKEVIVLANENESTMTAEGLALLGQTSLPPTCCPQILLNCWGYFTSRIDLIWELLRYVTAERSPNMDKSKRVEYFEFVLAEFASSFGWPGSIAERCMRGKMWHCRHAYDCLVKKFVYRIRALITDFTGTALLASKNIYSEDSRNPDYISLCAEYANRYVKECNSLYGVRFLDNLFESDLATYKLPAFHLAAALDDDATIKAMSQGAAINWYAESTLGTWEHTPIRIAVRYGSSPKRCLQILISADVLTSLVDISPRTSQDIVLADNYFCLRVAAGRGLWDVFEMLLEYETLQFDRLVKDAYPGLPFLKVDQVMKEKSEVEKISCKSLLVNADLAQFLLILAEHTPKIRDKSGHGLLWWAVEQDLEEVMYRLLRSKHSEVIIQEALRPDARGLDIIWLAMRRRKDWLIKTLAWAIEPLDGSTFEKTYFGLPSLYWAKRSRNQEIVEIVRCLAHGRVSSDSCLPISIGISLGFDKTSVAWYNRSSKLDIVQDINVFTWWPGRDSSSVPSQIRYDHMEPGFLWGYDRSYRDEEVELLCLPLRALNSNTDVPDDVNADAEYLCASFLLCIWQHLQSEWSEDELPSYFRIVDLTNSRCVLSIPDELTSNQGILLSEYTAIVTGLKFENISVTSHLESLGRYAIDHFQLTSDASRDKFIICDVNHTSVEVGIFRLTKTKCGNDLLEKEWSAIKRQVPIDLRYLKWVQSRAKNFDLIHTDGSLDLWPRMMLGRWERWRPYWTGTESPDIAIPRGMIIKSSLEAQYTRTLTIPPSDVRSFFDPFVEGAMSHIRSTIDGENYGQPSPPCSVIRIVLSGEALESYVGKRLELELVQEGYTVSQLDGGSELAAKGAVLHTQQPR